MITPRPSRPAARFVLSRLPRGSWLSPAEVEAVLIRAGIDPDPGYIKAVVHSLRRRGQVVTSRDNKVMRPASRSAA